MTQSAASSSHELPRQLTRPPPPPRGAAPPPLSRDAMVRSRGSRPPPSRRGPPPTHARGPPPKRRLPVAVVYGHPDSRSQQPLQPHSRPPHRPQGSGRPQQRKPQQHHHQRRDHRPQQLNRRFVPHSGSHSSGGTPASAQASPLTPQNDFLVSREDLYTSLGHQPQVEAFERREVCMFMQDCGSALMMKQFVIATAIVFFHRFSVSKKRVAAQTTEQKFVTATACLFLATKVEEAHRRTPLMRVFTKAYRVRYPNRDPLLPNTPDFSRLRLQVLAAERAVLSAIAFDLTANHPYTLLLDIVDKITPDEGNAAGSSPSGSGAAEGVRKRLVQCAWNVVNDSLRTTLCLQFSPKLIAVACVHMATKLTPDCEGLVSSNWYESQFSAKFEDLQQITAQLHSLYNEAQNSTPGVVNPGIADRLWRTRVDPASLTASTARIIKDTTRPTLKRPSQSQSSPSKRVTPSPESYNSQIELKESSRGLLHVPPPPLRASSEPSSPPDAPIDELVAMAGSDDDANGDATKPDEAAQREIHRIAGDLVKSHKAKTQAVFADRASDSASHLERPNIVPSARLSPLGK